MHQQSFFRTTTIYTLGNLLYRGASFILVPLYARVLAPAEYGTLELITITAFLVQSLLSSGVAHSALRFYFDHDTQEKRNTLISSVLIGSFAIASAGAGVFMWLAQPIASFVTGSGAYTNAFRLLAICIVLEISRDISLAFVRAQQRSGMFVCVSLVQLIVQVIVTVYTVVNLQMGVLGIIIGNTIATSAVWMVLTTFTLKQCGITVNWRALIPIARYGAPLMLSGVTAAAFQSIDRYTLSAYTTLQALGLYALALRIGNVIPAFLVQPFTTSYGPYRFSIMNTDTAKTVYGKVLTYYVFIASAATLTIASLSKEILILFAKPEYWPAHSIVPLVLIPVALEGVIYCVQTGLYIVKKTQYLFYMSVVTCAVKLCVLLLLTPYLGIRGAAIAPIVSSLYYLVHTYVLSQRAYRVEYEYGRIAKLISVAMAFFLLADRFHGETVWMLLLIKAAVIAMYPVALLLLGLYTAEEREWARAIWMKVRRIADRLTASYRPVDSVPDQS